LDQPEDGVERLGVVGLPLEAHELNVELIESFPGFGQELAQQLIHSPPQAHQQGRRRSPRAFATALWFVDHSGDFGLP
jgi:hypothetical protein